MKYPTGHAVSDSIATQGIVAARKPAAKNGVFQFTMGPAVTDWSELFQPRKILGLGSRVATRD